MLEELFDECEKRNLHLDINHAYYKKFAWHIFTGPSSYSVHGYAESYKELEDEIKAALVKLPLWGYCIP